MKKRAGKVWAWFDSWTKRVSAGAVAFAILSAAALSFDHRYAKSWTVEKIQYRLDKKDYLDVRKEIIRLDDVQKRRPLTPDEQTWLEQLRLAEREFLEQVRRQQK